MGLEETVNERLLIAESRLLGAAMLISLVAGGMGGFIGAMVVIAMGI